MRRSALAFAITIGACTAVRPYPAPVEESGPVLCANGVDDDLDGALDCEEPDGCMGYCPIPLQPPADGPDISCPATWGEGETLLEGARSGVSDGTWTARWCTRRHNPCFHEVDEPAEWVDAAAEEGGDGSRAHPHRTIAAAVDEAVAPGASGLVIVGTGRYAERVAPRADVEIRGACAFGAVSWTAPDDLSDPLIHVTGSHVTLFGLELAPSVGPAMLVEDGTVEAAELTVRGRAPLFVAATGAAIEIEHLSLDASGADPAIVGRPGSFVATSDGELRAEAIATIENAAIAIRRAELNGALSIRGAAGRLDAEQAFVRGVVAVEAGKLDVTQSAFRDGARLEIDDGARAEIDRTVFADGAALSAGADTTLETTRVAWARSATCGLRSAGQVTMSDATWVGSDDPLDPPDAALCIAGGRTSLERVAIHGVSGGAIRIAGGDASSPSAIQATDLTIVDACSAGCDDGEGAIRVEPGTGIILASASVAGTDGCALSWSGDGVVVGGFFVLERNRRALCGPRAPEQVDSATLIDNEVDLYVDGEASCAPAHTRGCGTPFVP